MERQRGGVATRTRDREVERQREVDTESCSYIKKARLRDGEMEKWRDGEKEK